MSSPWPPDVDEARVGLERDLSEAVAAGYAASHRLAHDFAQGHDLHTTDFRALTAIYVAENAGEPLTASRLGAELSLSSGAVTYLVDRLIASGHVRRDRDPADRRRVVLTYADHGRGVAGAFFGPLAMRTHAALAGFDDADLRTGLAVMEALTDAIRDGGAQASSTGGSNTDTAGTGPS